MRDAPEPRTTWGMSPSLSLTTFGMVFLAELGDKTQLTAMALATRYPWKRVLAGVALAFLILNAGAVLVGKALFEFVPLSWIRGVCAALFLCFGVNTLRHREDCDEDDAQGGAGSKRGAFLTAFSMILVAELGDKTQIVTAGLAAQHASQLSVFVGSTLALWTVSALGALLGSRLSRWIPLARVRVIAGILFLVFAAAAVFDLLRPWLFA